VQAVPKEVTRSALQVLHGCPARAKRDTLRVVWAQEVRNGTPAELPQRQGETFIPTCCLRRVIAATT